MTHTMRLSPGPFERMRSGQKTIELRLYDEKRRRLCAGDTIEFICTDGSGARLTAAVRALHVFDSFAALYRALPLTACGYAEREAAAAAPEDMDLYYSKEEQRSWGVVGIEIALLDAGAPGGRAHAR